MSGFKVTDEGLEALDASDDNTRTTFFEGLSDEERQSIADAVPAWKQRRQGRTGVTGPAQSVGTSGFSLEDPPPAFNATLPPTGTLPSFGVENAGGFGPPSAPPRQDPVIPGGPTVPGNADNPWAGPVVNGAGNTLEWLGDKGRDLTNSALKWNRGRFGPGEESAGAANELLSRGVMSTFLGDKVLSAQDDQDKMRGANYLSRNLGPNGAAAALIASKAAGMGAQMLIPGLGAQSAETAMGRVGTAALLGGTQGGLQAKIEGGDPILGAVAGGLLGGGITGGVEGAAYVAGKAGPALRKVAGKVAEFKGQAAREFWNSIDTWAGAKMAHAQTFGNELVSDIPAPVARLSEIKPSFARVDADDTGVKAIIYDYTINNTEKYAELRLDTESEIDAFQMYLKKHKVERSISPQALNKLSEYDNVRIADPTTPKSFKHVADLDLYATSEQDFADDLVKLSSPRNKATTIDLRKGPKGPPPPDIDAPIADPVSPDIELHVADDGHVVFKVPEPAKPIKLGGSSRGYIKGLEGAETVDRVANDPDMPGNILVFGKNNEMKSVAVPDFHPAMSLGDAETALRKVGAEPVRAPAVGGQVSAHALENDHTAQEVMNTVVRRSQSFGEKLFGNTGLVSKHHLGGRDMADMLREAKAVQDLGAVRNGTVVALAKAMGGKANLETALDRDLGKVFEGKMDFSAYKAKYPQVSAELEKVSKNAMSRVAAMEDQLIEMGALSPTNRMDRGDFERYLARQYYSYLLPKGKWARIAPQDAIDGAADFVTKEMSRHGEKWTGAQIRDELQTLLKAEDPMQAWQSSKLSYSKAFDRLRQKQEVPEPIRKVLGEVGSGTIRMAQTLAHQEQLLARFSLYNEIAANPAYYSHGPQPHLNLVPVPNNPTIFGPLAGGHVAPELHDMLVNLPKVDSLAPSFWSKVMGLRKGGLVASARAHVNSALGNWRSSVWAGGLDPFRPIESGKAMRDAARALHDYHADPTGKTGLGKLILEAKRSGADWAGASEVELGADNQFIKQVMKNIGKENGKDAFDLTEKFLAQTGGRYKNLIAKNGHLLDAQDRWFRVANYIALKRKALGNPGRYLPGIDPKDVEVQAAKWAARRINDSFMNAAHVGPKIESMRRNAVGFFAPFLTAQTEEARILGMLPSRFAEDPDLKWRMLGWSMFGAAAYSASRHGMMGGGSKEAIDSAIGNMTDKSRASRQALTAVPVPGWDNKDPVRLFDLTQGFLPAQLLSGHPDDGMVQRVLANAFLFPVEGGAGEAGQRSLLEQAGVIKPTDYDPRRLESEVGMTNAINLAMRTGAVPAEIPQIQSALGKMDYNGRFGQKFGAGDVAGKLLFSGYVGPTSPTAVTGIKEDKSTRRDLHSELKTIAREFSGGKITKAEAEAKMKIVVDAIKASGGKTAERGNLMKKYIDSTQGGIK